MTFIAQIHHLLLNYCTCNEQDQTRSVLQRQRYIDQVSQILSESRLTKRTEDQIWNLGWNKPFFAHIAAATVGPYVQRAREAGVFLDRQAVISPRFMTHSVPDAIERGHLAGACAVYYRLERLQAYARAVPKITEEVNRFHDDWLSNAFNYAELQERAVAIAEDISKGGGPIGKVKGFGFTTACHLLADLGLPVFKPDIWVCRIVSSLPGVGVEIRRAWQLTEDKPIPFNFLETRLSGMRASDAYRRIVQPVMNALVEDVRRQETPIADFDLSPAFLCTRFVDFTLVHFAISAETKLFGLERRPVDVLRNSNESLVPTHIKNLAHWLHAGQSSHAAEVALKKAETNLRTAKTTDQRVRAQKQLDNLNTPDSLNQRSELAKLALSSWALYEKTATDQRWFIQARYPEGFAARHVSGGWAYKRAALARRKMREQN